MRLRLAARPESGALVRQALIGLADVLSLDAALLTDMKTAVTEACNNVVVHAYDGREGPLEVEITPTRGQVVVVVRDEGRGILPGTIQSVGRTLIAALAQSVEFQTQVDGGTVVRMTFHTKRTFDESDGAGAATDTPPAMPDDEVGILISVGPLVGPVLGRVIAMLAARANFSMDRLTDAQMVSDSLTAHAPRYLVGHHLGVGISDGDYRLGLRVGPLVSGGSEGLVRDSARPGVEPLLERLSDDLSVEVAKDGCGPEFLRLMLADRS